MRRVHLRDERADHGAPAAARVAALLAAELGWDADRAAREAARYRESVGGG